MSIHSLYFLVGTLLPTYCRCRKLMLHLITISDTYSLWLHTIHNIHKRQISIPPARLEIAIPASEWSQIYVLDWAAIGIDSSVPPSLLICCGRTSGWIGGTVLHIWQSACWTFGSAAGVAHSCVQISCNMCMSQSTRYYVFVQTVLLIDKDTSNKQL
jgi:hypothetical protein